MNEKQPLTDATGNRRFMIIDCDDAVVCPTGEINYKLLTDNNNANLIALWAEAVARFTKGIDIDTSKDTTQFYGETVESWLLDRSFYNVANEHNEKYYAASEYEEWLMGTYIPEKVGNGATAEDWKSKFGKSEFILNAAREAKIDVTRNTQLRSAQMKHCGLEQIQTSKGNYWKPTSMKISTINSAVEVQKTHSVTEDKSVSLVDAVVEQKSIELQKKDEEIQLLKEQLAAQATAMKNMEAMMAQFMLQMGMSPVAPVVAAPVAPAPVVEPVVVVPKKEEPARRIRTTVKKEVVEAVVEPVVAAPKKEAVVPTTPAPRSTMLVTDLKTGKTSRQFVDIDDDGLDFTTTAPASFKSKSYDAATTSKVLGAQVDTDEDDAAE
jgi:head-tail adaptor